MGDQMMSVDEVAMFLGVKKSWLYDKVRRGKIPSYKVGKYRKFFLDEIKTYLEQECKGDIEEAR